MERLPERADELHHLAAAPTDPAWFETFTFEFASPNGEIGGFVAITLRPGSGCTWCWVCLAGEGRPVVAVVENDAPLPRHPGLELRAPGLWLDVECETPGDHVTVGMEAFGLAFDEPVASLGEGRGERIPVGLDLEWETGSAPEWHHGGYRLACRVTGEVLVSDERLDLEADGARAHCWGTTPWWLRAATPAPRAGDWIAQTTIAVPGTPAMVVSTLSRAASGCSWLHGVDDAMHR